MFKTNTIYLYLSVALLLLMCLLSISMLHPDSLYADEAISVLHMGNPYVYNNFGEVTHSIQVNSPQHAPGYFWLLSIWVRFTGYPQFALRAFSMLMGILGAAMIYRLARDMANKQAGLLALTLMSTSILYIFYMHEIRMYSQIFLVLTLQLWFYYRIISEAKPANWLWLGLYLSTVAALYTHYLSIFPIFGLCLYHLLFTKKDRRWWVVVVLLGLAGASFVPWINIVMRGSEDVASPAIRGSSFTLSWLLLKIFGNGNILLGILAIPCLVAAIVLPNRGLRMVVFIFVASWGAFAIANEISKIMPDYRSRYYLVFWSPLVVAAAIAASHYIRKRWILVGLTSLWLLVGIWYSGTEEFSYYNNRTRFNQSEYPPYPALIKAFYHNGLPDPHDLILISSKGSTRFALRQVNLYYSLRLRTRMDFILPPTWEEMLDKEAIDTSAVVWWAYAPQDDYQSEREGIVATIEETHQQCHIIEESSELVLVQFVNRLLSCDWINDTAIIIRFQEYPIELYGVKAELENGQLFIGTQWNIPQEVPLHRYSVAIKIYDEAGNFIKQADTELPYGIHTRQLTIVNSEGMAAGNYELRVSVYDWQTLEHLTGIQVENGLSGRETIIGQLSITD